MDEVRRIKKSQFYLCEDITQPITLPKSGSYVPITLRVITFITLGYYYYLVFESIMKNVM